MYAIITIDDIVRLLGLKIKPGTRIDGEKYDAQCPFCNDKHYKLNINRKKNVFRCNHCGAHGSALQLYALAVFGVYITAGTQQAKDIFAQLKKDLGYDTPEFRQRAKARNEMAHKGISRAPDDVVHKAYSVIIEFPHFSLSEDHHQALLNRGLDDDTIRKNGYCSISKDFSWTRKYNKTWHRFNQKKIYDTYLKVRPNKKVRHTKEQIVAGMVVANAALKHGCSLEGVPGFYQIKNVWIFNVSTGMLIPTRNIQGKIVAFQVRTSNPNCRYISISSNGFPHGVTERISRLHFPELNPALNSNVQVYITEGPLKADVASHLLDHKVFFVSIPGVNNNRKDLYSFFDLLADRGATGIVNALDMDKITNPNVFPACAEINNAAATKGLKVVMKFWDEQCCAVKYRELEVFAKEQGVNIPDMEGHNYFFKTMALTAVLIAKNVQISKNTYNGYYWCDETKGIDDYLKLIKQGK